MRETLRILVLIVALIAAALGAVLGLLTVALSFGGSGPDTLSLITLSGSASILSLSLGLAAAWHVWQAMQGSSSAAFQPRRIGLLAVLYVLALALGQVMLSLSLMPALAFPLLHVAVTAIPALIIMALIGRGLGGMATWRDLVLQATCGALLATPLAFIIEAIIVLMVTLGAILGLAWQPGGLNLLQRIATQLQDPAWFQDLGTLESVVLTPAVMVAAFAIVSGIIPTIEEAVKTIGVGIAAHRRPSLPQAVFWGSAAGAGFAITEGLLNATVDLSGWLPVVVLRIGTTLLHCTTGAFMGFAWYQALALRRRARAIALYLLSVVVHGLWNGLALGITLLSFKALDADLDGTGEAMAGLSTLVILGLYGILALGMAGGMASLTIRARRQHLAPATVSEQVVSVPQEVIALQDTGPED